MNILNSTKIFCSISNPGADLTGILYNSIIKDLSIDGIYIPSTATDVSTAFEGTKSFGFSGVTISMPYKKEIIKELDELDDKAKLIGAVNTVVEMNGRYIGSNTDWYGAIACLTEKVSLAGKKVLMVGAGGAAQAIAYGLKKEKALVTIANRTFKKAKSLASKYNFSSIEFNNEIDEGDYEILINATSIGFLNTGNSKNIFSGKLIGKATIVLDIVFCPTETEVINLCKKYNTNYILGSRMLVHQALKQFSLWGYNTNKSNVDLIESKLINFLNN